jgi:RTX calcium-binding nonapeptide repeat (4 copies)/WD40-like Beta Propeller Repeat
MRLRVVALAAILVTMPAHSTDAGICQGASGRPSLTWSPDGSRLAGIVLIGSCPSAAVVVADGAGYRSLDTRSFGGALSVRWSPDGRRLAAGLVYARYSIAVYDVASGAKKDIAEGIDPAWSPDGRTIAYRDMTDGIHLVAPDGTADRRVASGRRPVWSPDSTRIAYDRAGSVYVARIDGRGEEQVAAGEEAGWSPDGGAVTMLRDGATHIHPLDGSAETRVGMGRLVQWSPSGGEVALLDAAGVFRLVELRTGTKRRLAEDVDAAALRPQWDRLATQLRVGRQPEIYLSEPTGARPTRISPSQCRHYSANCLEGSDRADRIIGRQDRDVIFPGAGDDRVWGRGGDDRIDTAFGRDFVDAGTGNDIVVAHGNDDRLFGRAGFDVLYAGNGEDVVDGGAGRDSIYVAGDDHVDRVRCGPGKDAVLADPIDKVAQDCELIRRPPS